MNSRPLEKRFWAKVKKSDDGCWIWTGARNDRGYGQIGIERKSVYAHHLSYEWAFGPRDGLWVLHHCDNPPCVRPDHLFLGTHQNNMDDMVSKGRHLGVRNVARGERAGNAILTAAAVMEIRQKYTGRYGDQARLGRQFGVTGSCIRLVVIGRNWQHVA